MSSAPAPFRVAVPDPVLEDLARRLGSTRFPAPPPTAGWDYGIPLDEVEALVEHWRERFDWRAAEARLNAMPQFTADVDGLTLHYVHQVGTPRSRRALLFVHGWPGSFWEVHKILGPLTDPAVYGGDPADAFDVVAPSLPGFGFSPDPQRAGLGTSGIADLFTQLMTSVLGYDQFGVQGGDWGAYVATELAHRHPERVTALHVNLMGVVPDMSEAAPPRTADEDTFLGGAAAWQAEESGYVEIQRTKPQTLAYGLTDSPAGLAAWIVEKFRGWSDCGGDVANRFDKDELLTNVMIYWVTGTIGSSVRLYRDAIASGTPLMLGPGERIEPPAGFARFAAEINRPPRSWVERAYNLVQWGDFDRGGHFAALEEPDLLVDELRSLFRHPDVSARLPRDRTLQ
jgi:pimeloyl-ACP methyl ester carboxylesterase